MKKRIASMLFALTFCLVHVFTVYAAEYTNDQPAIPEERQFPRLVDTADLLSESEEGNLLAKLDEISERQQLDIVIVTVYSLNGKTSTEYADDFYDYNGYGMGKNKDGILLLIGMEDRDWAISTCGYGISAFTDAGQEYITDKFLSDLSDGNYSNAFNKFADLCDDFITQAKTDAPYDSGNLPKEPFNFVLMLCISLGMGIVVAFIAVTYMKSQLKSVQPQKNASNYVKSGSMQITQSMDLFLYHVVTRTVRPKDNDNYGSSGSSVHTSSSGTSHGGSSGHF